MVHDMATPRRARPALPPLQVPARPRLKAQGRLACHLPRLARAAIDLTPRIFVSWQLKFRKQCPVDSRFGFRR